IAALSFGNGSIGVFPKVRHLFDVDYFAIFELSGFCINVHSFPFHGLNSAQLPVQVRFEAKTA
ncbi:MAG TPA: hypothetical protein VN843_10180, partial [Anaerolineales bacterium]|nr:hypothetical protein [Anaerolineales bacterium]